MQSQILALPNIYISKDSKIKNATESPNKYKNLQDI